MQSRPSPRRGPLGALSRFARPTPRAGRCELCGGELAAEHAHLAEPAARRLVCCCGACALLFGARQAGRYRLVPPRREPLPDLRVPDGLWERLGVPVGLTFFYRSTLAGQVLATYPSPAGPLESPVPAAAWEELANENALLRELEPDVEALMVNHTAGAREQYRVSLDYCYELVGLVRTHWRGLSGGPELWDEVGRFFAALRGSER